LTYSARFGSLERAITSSDRVRALDAVPPSTDAAGVGGGAGSDAAFFENRPRFGAVSSLAARSIAAGSTPSASSAAEMSCGSSSIGWNRSPTDAHRSHTLSIRKSCGVTPASTSSQVNGVETVARASGRIEYAAAMFAPSRFMLWSMNTWPPRSLICHAIVTRSESAVRISCPARPTNSRTTS
jgi:hypothetical protein